MSDMVKVIWDGARKFGVATGPGAAVFFEPGINEIPADVWKQLTKGVGSKDPGGVNHHLKGGMLRLASDDVQEKDSIGDMKAEAAVEVVNECFDETDLDTLSDQEQGRKGGARKTVKDAIAARAQDFDKLEKGKGDQNKSEE